MEPSRPIYEFSGGSPRDDAGIFACDCGDLGANCDSGVAFVPRVGREQYGIAGSDRMGRLTEEATVNRIGSDLSARLRASGLASPNMVRGPRVEALLGASLDDADEEALARLVDGAVDEDSDLEFKRELYGNGESERRDLAGDVAALANLGGGLLILGIDDQDGRATGLAPQPLSETEELRMRQILAANVAPHLPVTIRRVPSSETGLGYYLIGVPRSPHAPHAVRVGNALRYPRRDGRNIRWLAESEVADAYRNRFVDARSQTDRIGRIREVLTIGIRQEIPDAAWLLLASVPDIPGHGEMTRTALRDLHSFPAAVGQSMLRLRRITTLQYAAATPRAGHRRAVLRFGSTGQGEVPDAVIHLFDDGAVGFVVRVGWMRSPRPHEPTPEYVDVDDEVLTQDLMFGLAVAARHAVDHAMSGGAAAVSAQLVSAHPMKLSHSRGSHGMGGHWASDVEERTSGVSEHSVDLTAMAGSAVELLVSTRLVVTDLLQSLGVPECPQIAPDGAIRYRYWTGDNARIEAACEMLGVRVSAETLED